MSFLPLRSFPSHFSLPIPSHSAETSRLRHGHKDVPSVLIPTPLSRPRIPEPPFGGDSEIPPLSLRARSPARVQMEPGPGRVKFLDLFICSLLHLLMSLSPQPDDPSTELGRAREDGALRTRGTPHAPQKAALGSLLASATRKRPRAARGSRGPRSRRPAKAAATAPLGEPPPEAAHKAPSPPICTGEGSRGRRGGVDNSFPTRHRARLCLSPYTCVTSSG